MRRRLKIPLVVVGVLSAAFVYAALQAGPAVPD